MRKAIKKHNLRFLGVAGYSVSIPGVPDEYDNPLVKKRGVHVIAGTSDYRQSDEHDRLQSVAADYAERYNRLLMAYLSQINDPVVSPMRRKIDEELARLERRNPLEDAKKAAQAASSLLLVLLLDGNNTVPGIDRKVLESAARADSSSRAFGPVPWSAVFVPEVMTPVQRQRFDKQVSRYIVPYNRYAFEGYLARKKANK
ncbi:MAG: hypothetical protein EON58_17345 [Alphaproteobacteria bacterium]|nr:MAG: hypothetical protein EON58_17345 [Alphaproteobacteria bacterium]